MKKWNFKEWYWTSFASIQIIGTITTLVITVLFSNSSYVWGWLLIIPFLSLFSFLEYHVTRKVFDSIKKGISKTLNKFFLILLYSSKALIVVAPLLIVAFNSEELNFYTAVINLLSILLLSMVMNLLILKIQKKREVVI